MVSRAIVRQGPLLPHLVAAYGKPVFALTPAIATARGELAAGDTLVVNGWLSLACRAATGRIAGSSTYARGAMSRTPNTAATTRTSRETRGGRSMGITIPGRRRCGHAIDGTLRRGHAIEGTESRGICGTASLGCATAGVPGPGSGSGGTGASGTNVARAMPAGDDSMGPPHRSHQISMPRLGYAQDGQRTAVPVARSFKPTLSTSGSPQVGLVEEPARGGVDHLPGSDPVARLPVDAFDHIDVHDGNAVLGPKHPFGQQTDLLSRGKPMVDVLGRRIAGLHPRRPQGRRRPEVMAGHGLIEICHRGARVACRRHERGLPGRPGVLGGILIGRGRGIRGCIWRRRGLRSWRGLRAW